MSDHEYVFHCDKEGGRTNVYAVLALLSLGFSLLLIRILHEHPYIKVVAEFVEAAAPLAVFAILHGFFRKYAWNTPSARPVFAIARSSRPPDLTGSYAGKLRCFEPEGALQQNNYEAEVTITQDWERMLVHFHFPNPPSWMTSSRSDSEIAVLRGNQQVAELDFEYRHDRVLDENTGILRRQIHGFTNLQFERKADLWEAHGTYFSEDGGSGTITLNQNRVPEAARSQR